MGKATAGRRARAAVIMALVVSAIVPATAGAVTLYVSNFNGSSVSVFDLASGVPAPVACDPTTACKSNPFPAAIAVDPSASHVYTASNDNPGKVSVFSIGPGGVLAPVTCDPTTACKAGNSPEGIAIDPAGRHVYVANRGDGSLSLYSIQTGGTLTPITCDPGTTCAVPAATGIAVDPSGTHLYVASETSPGKVSVFAIAADGTVTPLPCVPATNCQTVAEATGLAIDPAGSHLYVTTGNSVAVFAIGAGGALTPVTCDPTTICKTGPGPVGVAVDPSGTHVYTSNSGGGTGGNSVSAFAIGAGGVLAPVTCDPATACKTGQTPDGLAIEPNGARLYTSSSNGSSVSPFTIAAGGTLVPITCDPTTTCKTGSDPDYFSVAITPDRGPRASFVVSAAPAGGTSSFDASASTSPDYPITSYAWDFGDGTTQTTSAPTVSHAYTQPGVHTATLTVTDAAHCSTGLVFTGQTAYCTGSDKARTSRTVTIAASGPTLRARISVLRIRPSTLVAASSGPAVTAAAKKRRRTGATISYRDSQAATTTFTVQRPRAGRRSGRKCVKPNKRNRGRRHCTRFVRTGRFTHKDTAGVNRFHFTGRLRGHKLRPGKYRLRAVARTASGNGPASFRSFRVKR